MWLMRSNSNEKKNIKILTKWQRVLQSSNQMAKCNMIICIEHHKCVINTNNMSHKLMHDFISILNLSLSLYII